jgi:hypothetical protein
MMAPIKDQVRCVSQGEPDQAYPRRACDRSTRDPAEGGSRDNRSTACTILTMNELRKRFVLVQLVALVAKKLVEYDVDRRTTGRRA